MSKGRFEEGNTIPVKYKTKYCQEIIDFFLHPETTNLSTTDKVSVMTEIYPTIEAFASKIGVVKQTLYNWGEKYRRFGLALARVKEIQLNLLLKNGLLRRYDSNIVKFVLTNNFGMKEKSENEMTYKIVSSNEIDEESN